MLQTYIAEFKDSNELNKKVAEIESCKYNKVVDIRPLSIDREYGGKYMILFDYDMVSYMLDYGEKACDGKCGSEYID